MKVNLYDFDHTIYNGDASLDFILFSMRRYPRLWRYIPSQVVALIGYIAGVKTRKEIKQIAFRFLRDITDVDEEVRVFWRSHESRILLWYKKQAKKTDIIASASPEFLLAPMLMQLGIKHFVATDMDKTTGRIVGQNCRSEEKVIRLKKYHLASNIKSAYSDSLSDMPIFDLAEQAYVVKGDRIIELEEYTPSKLSRLKSPEFLRFLFVGGMSAILGVGLAFSVSLFMSNGVWAFIIGYAISLVPSYFLNSIITFHDRVFTTQKFLRFCLSYIPNFIIQLIAVTIFIQTFDTSPLLAYGVSVVIAVPITFLLLSFFTFSNTSKK